MIAKRSVRQSNFREAPLQSLSTSAISTGLGLSGANADRSLPRYIRITDIHNPTTLRKDSFASQPREKIGESTVEYGDILFASVGATVGVSYLHSEKDGEYCYAGYLSRFRPNKLICDFRFVSYWSQSEHYWDQVRTTAVTSTISNLSASRYSRFRIPLPPLPTQRAIADHLDRETAEIDAMAAELDELLSLLQSRSFRLLLDVYSDLADGSVPFTSLKYVLSKLDRPVEEESGIVTAFRDGQVTLRSKRREAGFTNSERNDGYQGVEVGDVVFHGLDGFAGACGVSDSHGSSSPVYHVCSTGDAVYPEFIARMLRSMGMSGLLAAYSWSVRQRAVDYRNWAVFGSLKVPVPPRDEQRRIVEHLDEVTAEIDSMIADAQELKALLAERRSALITEVVTGRKVVAG